MSDVLDWLPISELPRRTLEVDEVLIVQGARSDTLHAVLAGGLHVDLETEAGTYRLGRTEPGGWAGEAGLIEPGPATATVVAAEPTTLVSFDHATYATWRQERSHHVGMLLSHVACDLARRLRAAGEIGLEVREGGELKRLVPIMRTLMGVDRKEIRPAWVPTSSAGHAQSMDDGEVLARLDAAGAFRPPSAAETEYTSALREDLQAIASTLAIEAFQDGEVICQEGAAASGLYIILEGQVRQVAGRSGVWMHEDVVHGPGERFALVPFFDDGKQRATCTAKGDVTVAVMYASTVQHLIRSAENDQALGLHLMDWFVRQLVADSRKLNARLVANAEATGGEGAA